MSSQLIIVVTVQVAEARLDVIRDVYQILVKQESIFITPWFLATFRKVPAGFNGNSIRGKYMLDPI